MLTVDNTLQSAESRWYCGVGCIAARFFSELGPVAWGEGTGDGSTVLWLKMLRARGVEGGVTALTSTDGGAASSGCDGSMGLDKAEAAGENGVNNSNLVSS